MTPEEHAQSLVRAWADTTSGNTLRKQLAAMIRRAVVEERNRCASLAALYFVHNPYGLHPDIHFDDLNEAARTVAHSTAQSIAAAIQDEP